MWVLWSSAIYRTCGSSTSKKYLFTCLNLIFTPKNNLLKAFNTRSTEIYRISISVHLFLNIIDLPRHWKTWLYIQSVPSSCTRSALVSGSYVSRWRNGKKLVKNGSRHSAADSNKNKKEKPILAFRSQAEVVTKNAPMSQTSQIADGEKSLFI